MDQVVDIISTAEVDLVPVASAVLTAALTAISLLDLSFLQYPPQAIVYNGQRFDYIIVGAGSAGCVIANRLTEVPGVNVLLIEAGGDPPIDSAIPSLFPFLENSIDDWGYYSQDDGYSSQALEGNHIHMTRGKVLGGCSSFNYLYYVRAARHDYENWGWIWDQCLHYFKKSERMNSTVIRENDVANYHNYTGPMGVTRPEWGDTIEEVLLAFQENGRKILIDYNGPESLGYSEAQFTIDNNIRQSTAAAFLSPIRNRQNLYLLKRTFVRRILFNGNVAAGVEVRRSTGNIMSLFANKEVIICAGAINSPQLLMLSGIGPRAHLTEMGIPVRVDSPNVGQRLQDHATVLVSLTAEKNLESAVENLEFFTNLNTFPTPSFQGFVALNEAQGFADYQAVGFKFPTGTLLPTLICTTGYKLDKGVCKAIAESGQTQETIVTSLTMLHPESRGEIKLNSSIPEDKPLIYLKYFSNPIDLERCALYMEDYTSVRNTPRLEAFQSEIVDYKIEQCQGLELGSHEYWKCHCLNIAHTLWHPVGTCVMGTEADTVVDTDFNVRGVQHLRVVDASVMPEITSGNTNAPTIMIAETASDIIKQDM